MTTAAITINVPQRYVRRPLMLNPGRKYCAIHSPSAVPTKMRTSLNIGYMVAESLTHSKQVFNNGDRFQN